MMSRLAQQVIIVLIPPLALIFLVLGTIFLGIATPTEGGAMGAVGALVMAAAKGRLTLDVVRQALASTTQAVVLRAVHPDRRAGFLPHLLWRERPYLGRASAGVAAGWRDRLPDRRQHAGLPARLLPGFLRACLHHRAVARAGRRQAWDRPDLVRRAARRQHADQLHASALRLCAVLPAIGRRACALSRQADRQDASSRSPPARSTGARCRSSAYRF